MSAFDELMQAVHEEELRRKNPKEWEILSEKILFVTQPDEIIGLQKVIDQFMASNAPEEDKVELSGYLECYYMKLDAILPGGVIGAGIFDIVEEASTD